MVASQTLKQVLLGRLADMNVERGRATARAPRDWQIWAAPNSAYSKRYYSEQFETSDLNSVINVLVGALGRPKSNLDLSPPSPGLVVFDWEGDMDLPISSEYLGSLERLRNIVQLLPAPLTFTPCLLIVSWMDALKGRPPVNKRPELRSSCLTAFKEVRVVQVSRKDSFEGLAQAIKSMSYSTAPNTVPVIIANDYIAGLSMLFCQALHSGLSVCVNPTSVLGLLVILVPTLVKLTNIFNEVTTGHPAVSISLPELKGQVADEDVSVFKALIRYARQPPFQNWPAVQAALTAARNEKLSQPGPLLQSLLHAILASICLQLPSSAILKLAYKNTTSLNRVLTEYCQFLEGQLATLALAVPPETSRPSTPSKRDREDSGGDPNTTSRPSSKRQAVSPSGSTPAEPIRLRVPVVIISSPDTASPLSCVREVITPSRIELVGPPAPEARLRNAASGLALQHAVLILPSNSVAFTD